MVECSLPLAPVELPDGVLGTLAEGREAYVAVETANGPHVTPELYAWSGGRLWFAAAVSTLKAKVLPDRPRAGAVVTVAGRSVMLHGTVSVFDPRRPVDIARRASAWPQATRAITGYVLRNVPDLVAFARDAAIGRLGLRIPPLRALFALEPDRVALVENDALVARPGAWPGSGAGALGALGALDDTPDVPAGGTAAVAAFPGPVAVPARWFAPERRAHVAPALLALLDLPDSFDVAVVVDDYTAPGPAAKRGRLVRGRGTLAAGSPGHVDVDCDRAVEWEGVETRRDG
jgi:hypothetical protein